MARATIYRRYRDKADLITTAIAGNSTTHLAAGPSDDPRGDLVAYLEEFDERFAESCLEVVGTLIGAAGGPGGPGPPPPAGGRAPHEVRAIAVGRAGGELRADADLDLALEMLVGSVFARRVAGQPSTPGWAERAVDTVWVGMGGR